MPPATRLVNAEIGVRAMLGVKIASTRVTGFKMTTRGAITQRRCACRHDCARWPHMIEKIPPDLSRFLICPMPGLLPSR
jgi:propionyl-CoA carboxylase alpha chain